MGHVQSHESHHSHRGHHFSLHRHHSAPSSPSASATPAGHKPQPRAAPAAVPAAELHPHPATISAYPELVPFLVGNQEWAARTAAAEPAFLPTLAQGQAPPVLWFGCADSRVPETTIMGRRPGDVFVHRNIANQFHKDDTAAHAVLDYAVLHLGVRHVVVVGHTRCGGCNGAWAAPPPCETMPLAPGAHGPEAGASADPLGAFLAPLIAIRHALPADATVDDLVAGNVRTSVRNVAESATMRAAWAGGKDVVVHGWVYDLESGLLADLGVSEGPRPKREASASDGLGSGSDYGAAAADAGEAPVARGAASDTSSDK